MLDEIAVDALARRKGAAQQHQRLAAQLGRRERAATAREPMRARGHERERFVPERQRVDLRRARRHEREARIEAVFDEQRLHARLRHRVDRQHDVRIRGMKRVDERAAQIGREGRHHREPQRAGREIGRIVQRTRARVERVQRRACVLRVDVAEFGEPHRAARAVEQRHAERFLELANLLRQRRLRHMQRIGRARETALLGDGQEIADVTKQHDGSSIGFTNASYKDRVLDAMTRFPHHTHIRSAQRTRRRAPGRPGAAV
ncbi:hypothetical protein FEP81_03535 [Burkholderia multivorans]|nr:hypothetical protein [Burkholderia multivorans]